MLLPVLNRTFSVNLLIWELSLVGLLAGGKLLSAGILSGVLSGGMTFEVFGVADESFFFGIAHDGVPELTEGKSGRAGLPR